MANNSRYWGRNHRIAEGKEPKNPRNVEAMMMKFLDWNMWGHGKRETSSRGSIYWHRGDVFYRSWKPVARCLHAAGEGVVLFKLLDEHCGWHLMKDHLPNERIFNVEDICVFGVAEGLAMGQEAFLETLRMQLIGKAAFLADTAHGLSYDRCYQWVRDYGKMTANGKPLNDANDWRIGGATQQITSAGDAYSKINTLFDCGWPPFDDATLLAQFYDAVHARAATYTANAPKRERAKARKEGAEALGLEEEAA